MARTASSSWPFGSGSDQSCLTPGTQGQASPHPIVTTTAARGTPSKPFGDFVEMSIPLSAIASTATGLTRDAGFDPQE